MYSFMSTLPGLISAGSSLKHFNIFNAASAYLPTCRTGNTKRTCPHLVGR